VKFLGFSKQRLNPQTAFTHGFLIFFGLAIGFRFVEIVLEK
jgi:hypothetical protein